LRSIEMKLFDANETFEVGSAARQVAYLLAETGEALSEIQPGWEHSPAKREMLGLSKEFGDSLASHYLDWQG
jgi:hypothetical protein